MSRLTCKLPKDVFLNPRKWNNISDWSLFNQEWAGTREKYIVSPPKSNVWYLLKFPDFGVDEIYYELFNCFLGFNLGLDCASYFPCVYKGKKAIITRSFLGNRTDGAELWEMKDLICHYSGNLELGKKFGRSSDVLKEHDIDTIFMILNEEFGHTVIKNFVKMVGFDCLIGHTDRHWENYGVILKIDKATQLDYRFAPIYDTATSYMLGQTDQKIATTMSSGILDTDSWYRPNIRKNTCKITVEGDIRTNHLDLFEYILTNAVYSNYIEDLLRSIKAFNLKIARHLLGNYFKGLSQDRKNVILKILEMRHRILLQTADRKLKNG